MQSINITKLAVSAVLLVTANLAIAGSSPTVLTNQLEGSVLSSPDTSFAAYFGGGPNLALYISAVGSPGAVLAGGQGSDVTVPVTIDGEVIFLTINSAGNIVKARKADGDAINQ